MTPTDNSEPNYSWDEIPPLRRHLYFYLLLVLGAIVANSFRGESGSQGRLAFAPAPPPRMTSQDVYPAPVPNLSPKPSDDAQ